MAHQTATTKTDKAARAANDTAADHAVSQVTAIPGPRSQELQAERERYVPRGVFAYHPVYPASGSGARITDMDGNTYLDFAGGIGVMNVGHSHPEVVAAIQQQAALYTHTCAHVLTPPPYVELARRLTEIMPGNFAKKTLLVNSGAEAVENAIKIARAATGRSGVISFENSFHGRTNLALALTGKVRPYRQDFGPFASNIHTLPYPYVYRCPQHSGTDGADCHEWRDALERAFLTHIPAEQVAAIIVEPVQGEGGFVVPPAHFLPELRAICTQYGILLIVDEIQSGFGRTGKLFAIEHSGIEPDLMLMAKSLAGGLPLAAVVGRDTYMDAPLPGGLGGTYGGNPVACAAALAVLDIFEREGLADRGRVIGERAMARMQSWRERFPLVGETRGLGAMVAAELVTDRATRAPATAAAGRILVEARERGLILIKAGLYDNVIRMLMPLVITEEELDEALDILEEALEVVSNLSPEELASSAH
jgi:4-aminobutyrate aminotransferase / (S)-3-amino-2-methylpropionate transaminase / 5-aminovalerate transaminase